jgi:hypothetical protein
MPVRRFDPRAFPILLAVLLLPACGPDPGGGSPGPAPSGGVRGYTLHRPGALGLKAASAAAPAGGLQLGWLAVLDLPDGAYVVSASATFSRRDHDQNNGTVRVFCTLGGLDRTVTVQFFIHPPELEPDPAVVVPFDVAGRGRSVFLKCPWGGPVEIYAENITINAVAVDELIIR